MAAAAAAAAMLYYLYGARCAREAAAAHR
eukprot:COSAG01_NODE_24604_length_773_cov_1.213650_1_plen_28_part_10